MRMPEKRSRRIPLLTTAAAVALVCAVAPALAGEARVKHPQPVDSLLYPEEYGSSKGTHAIREDRERDRDAAEMNKAAAPSAASKTKTPAKREASAPATKTPKKKSAALADTSERPLGTPGSPTTKGVRGTPGEKPMPGRK